MTRLALRRGLRLALLPLLLAALALAVQGQPGKEKPPAAPAPKRTITVKLVTDFDTKKPVSDLETIQPVKTTVFDKSGSRELTLGERCVLWVRNAHIDGKFFFERYYQDKYIGRNATLGIDAVNIDAIKPQEDGVVANANVGII